MRIHDMNRISTTLITMAAFTTLALPVFAGRVPDDPSRWTVQPSQTTIAKLESASAEAQRQARGNKNNLEFRRKSYEIDQLIERMKSGQKVDPAELDKALEPASVW